MVTKVPDRLTFPRSPFPARAQDLGAGITEGVQVMAKKKQAPLPEFTDAVLPLKCLQPDPNQPRKEFDADALAGLADTIRLQGLLQPIVVTEIPEAEQTDGRTHQILDGERRWRACQLAQLQEVPCRVTNLAGKDLKVAQLVANVQRSDLNPLELADACVLLMEQHGLTRQELAAQTGVTPRTLRDVLMLPKLPELARQAVTAQSLPVQTAAIIGRVPAGQAREMFALQVVGGNAQRVPGLNEITPTTRALTLAAAHALLNERYVISLKGTPWKQTDKTLLPEAGDCKSCPKRAGNAQAVDPETYEGLRGDMCLDVECYQRKKAAYALREVDKARESGFTILTAQHAANAGFSGSPWTRLDNPIHGDYYPAPGKLSLREMLTEKGLDFTKEIALAYIPPHHLEWFVRTEYAERELSPRRQHRQTEPAPTNGEAPHREPEPPERAAKTRRPVPAPEPEHTTEMEYYDPTPAPQPQGVQDWQVARRAEQLGLERVLEWTRGTLATVTSGDGASSCLQLACRLLLGHTADGDGCEVIYRMAERHGVASRADDDDAEYVARWQTWLETAPSADLIGFLVEYLARTELDRWGMCLEVDAALSLAGTSRAELLAEARTELEAERAQAGSAPAAAE